MDNDLFLGCDIGTGSCKIVAMNRRGVIQKKVQSFYQVHHPRPGYAEQDPEVIRQAFVGCLQSIMRDLPVMPVSLGFSSCMHSLIMAGEDGKALYPMITWEDNRSREVAARLRKMELGRQFYHDTGTPIHSMSPLCKISWLSQNEPALFSKTSRFIGIKEYIWHWMFGKYEVDYSIASATGIFNIHNKVWDEAALNFCGIDAQKLSVPVPTSAIRLHPTDEFLRTTGTGADMQYCIGSSDGCMANVGSGVEGAHQAAVTIGTSAAARVTGTRVIEDYSTMIFNYVLDETRFVSGGPLNNGGNVLQWLFREILGISQPDSQDYESLESSLALIEPGSRGLVCLPWLFGERAPVWDENARAVWFGVTNTHTKFHMIRAALEGVCFNLKTILLAIEKSGEPIEVLHASGGFVRSDVWVQMLADITGKKVVINDSGDASALGAAMWARQSTNHGTQEPVSMRKKIVTPRPQFAELLNKQFDIFLRLYEVTKDEMHRTAGI